MSKTINIIGRMREVTEKEEREELRSVRIANMAMATRFIVIFNDLLIGNEPFFRHLASQSVRDIVGNQLDQKPKVTTLLTDISQTVDPRTQALAILAKSILDSDEAYRLFATHIKKAS
ncbi:MULTISPECIES: hypothetical protein [unclassified Psychrobacillus]|uniref:hypothetical protein n=1 Tax=unclassified Psychrobacillus TaxID=2636677 RepID=UPI0030F7CA6A